jgi:tetratricopeptide (TPR) repeat protein
MELSDLEAAGEPLPADAFAFQTAHVARCAECAREAAIWRAVRPIRSEAAAELGEVDDVLRDVAERRQRSQFVERRRRTLLVAGASALACAAAVVLWFQMARRPDVVAARGLPTTGAHVTAPIAQPVPSSASASATRTEPSCSQPVAGVTVCLAADTEITSQTLDAAHRIVELGRGRAIVSLVPQPAGTSFSIGTPTGKVTAVGTIFSVEVGSDGASVARVIHGRVLVQAKADGIARPLRAGESLRIGAQTPTPLSALDRRRDQELLSMSAEPQGQNVEPSPSTSSGARAGYLAPQEMLEQARALRARREFAQAAELYRKIHAASPQSASGRAALVSLGELLLSSLDDPQGALRAFDGYLTQGGGALAQEAAFGKARALRALQRPREERLAIERFLAAYPEAPQSRVLRHRLSALGE